jgi:hypothetical protein
LVQWRRSGALLVERTHYDQMAAVVEAAQGVMNCMYPSDPEDRIQDHDTGCLASMDVALDTLDTTPPQTDPRDAVVAAAREKASEGHREHCRVEYRHCTCAQEDLVAALAALDGTVGP